MSNPAEKIIIKGARVHNLKNIDITISRNKFVVITGVSGSGKSSLAFETLYAEGQRRYIESLSAYARQFLRRINKPEVDEISGIPPAIAIEQKVKTNNPRSTVGTSTEIYDFLKILYTRIGKTISPFSGNEVKRHTVSNVVDFILNKDENEVVIIMAPLEKVKGRSWTEHLDILLKQGFSRIMIDNKIHSIRDINKEVFKNKKINLVIDRIRVVKDDEDLKDRISDSVSTAFFEGKEYCKINILEEGKTIFSNQFEENGIKFLIPSENMFSFNNPLGACPVCEGYGRVIGIDKDLVIPNKALSIYETAIVCWKGEKMKRWNDRLIRNAHLFNFPIHKPYYSLTEGQKKLIWTGNKYFRGLNSFFKYVESKQYKIQYRIMLARYRGKTTCTECKGKRLRKEAEYVKINNKSITDIIDFPLFKLRKFFKRLKLTDYEQTVSERVLIEINSRLDYLCNVGIEYLTLNRLSATLSGGESQRINLATSLGSNLTGALYILDEPSIGLHPRDTEKLILILKQLRDFGNTVLVVEHDEEIIRAADEVIDIGPYAGFLGGEIIFKGTVKNLLNSNESLTAGYLNYKLRIPIPKSRRKWNNYIEITNAHEHNLKNINVKFPLHVMTVITGVSGSGKSTLLHDIFYKAIQKKLGLSFARSGQFHMIKGDFKLVKNIEYIDQNPIGKISRSNPVTYLKIYDEIRKLFATQPLAKQLDMKPSHFSFNVDGGRCDECKGEGVIKIEMQFMADLSIVCESCNGKRFNEDVLTVKYRGKNIFDILDLRINEAIDFFSEDKINPAKKIVKKLQIPAKVGLDYLKLGQPSSTLSGGESQRIKLSYFLLKDKIEHTIFIFDEPTIGLHFHDINKLLNAFSELLNKGHTIFVIEHNMDIVKCADWIIDLGLEGGDKGGNIVFEGTPEQLVTHKKSYTAKYLDLKF